MWPKIDSIKYAYINLQTYKPIQPPLELFAEKSKIILALTVRVLELH